MTGNTKILLISLSLFCICSNIFAWDVPPSIYPYEIKFNHDTGSSSSDGINLKDNYGASVTAPEWTSSVTKKFAYVRSIDPTVKVQFYSPDPDTGTSITMLALVSVGTAYWDLGEKTFCFYASGYSDVIEFVLDDGESIPNSVGKWYSIFDWKVSKIGATSYPNFHMASTRLDYYTVYDTPVTTMETPWVGVLDGACDWAHGCTTALDVLSDVTTGIYEELGDTDGGIDYRVDPVYTSDNYLFDLEDFLYHLSSEDSVRVNCYDVANIFNIYTTALGISTQTKRIWNDEDAFTTNSADAIGCGIDDFVSYQWYRHQFGYYNSSYVYDPCIRFNPGSPYIPIHIIEATYYNLLIQSGNYEDSATYTCYVGTVKNSMKNDN